VNLEILSQADFVQVRFTLEFTSRCCLQPTVFAKLPGQVRLVGQQLLDDGEPDLLLRWRELFQPRVSDDPIALRRFQKPSPAFVLRWPFLETRTVEAGDSVALEILFFGSGIALIPHFARSLIHLGRLGLVDGGGRYEIPQVHSLAADQSWAWIWRSSEPLDALAPNLLSLGGWLDTCLPLSQPLMLEFATPVRLMAQGRPLRKVNFAQLFPFMLRRVTSMLHAHFSLEVVDEPTRLLEAVCEVEVLSCELRWQDWQKVGAQRRHSVGGFVGAMVLNGPLSEEIDWVLALSALTGVGKTAALGAGKLSLSSSC